MADIVSKSVRSRMMSGIRGKNTKPEMLIRQALFARGFRYRLHRRDLPGAPDILLPKFNAALFVHGCFWHGHAGCPYFKLPSSNSEFWATKICGNVRRDEASVAVLRARGWRVLVIWECATRTKVSLDDLYEDISTWLRGSNEFKEIGANFLHSRA